jgi:hypothetical protein
LSLRPMFWEKHAPGYLANHDAIKPVHADADPLALSGPLLESARTAVVAIGPAFPCVLDHGGAAMAASGDAGKKGGPVHHSRGYALGSTTLEQGLSRVEGLLVDYGRHSQGDPLRWRAHPLIAAIIAVEVVQP